MSCNISIWNMFFGDRRRAGLSEDLFGEETVDAFAALLVEVVRRVDLDDFDVVVFAV